MTAEQAAKRLEKLLGPKGAWRTNPKALTADKKPTLEMMRAASVVHSAARDAAEARLVVLKQDAEFLRLRDVQKQARLEMERVQGEAMRYRVTVGTTDGGMFFVVKAQGDNWAEVIRKLEEKAK